MSMKMYENCEVKSIEYKRSDTIEKQGPRDAITKYLKKRYYVKEARNRYLVLVRPSRVIITVKSSAGTQDINMKQEILEYYGKQKISENLIGNFKQNIDNKKIVVCLDTNGDYLIKNVIDYQLYEIIYTWLTIPNSNLRRSNTNSNLAWKMSIQMLSGGTLI